jgi:hypothetical protein
MMYEGMAIGTIVIGALLLLLSLRVLRRSGWLLGWLRGMMGLVLVACGVSMGLLAMDILAYKQLTSESSLATISFERLAEQQYKTWIVDAEGREMVYVLKGDQWQLDARIIKWPGTLAAWGMKPGYRLDRISGRYYSLDMERNAERSVFSIASSQTPFDLWVWLQRYDAQMPFVDAVYGSAAYVPMEDGASYEVMLSNSGLLARPLNDAATQAVGRWQ